MVEVPVPERDAEVALIARTARRASEPARIAVQWHGQALEWLEGEVTGRDVGLLFLAGHSVTDAKQRFYYLPIDRHLESLRRTAVSGDEIQETVGALAGKALMFIDACHSARGLNTFGQASPRLFRKARSATSLQSMIDARNCW